MPSKRYFTRWKLFVLAFAGYGCFLAVKLSLTYFHVRADAETIRNIVASEELILELTPRLKGLSNSVLNLHLPSSESYNLFQPKFTANDLQQVAARPVAEKLHVVAKTDSWPVSPDKILQEPQQHRLWRPLLKEVDYFEHAKFYFVRGEFLDKKFLKFDSEVGFKALARTIQGRWLAVHAKQHIVWQRDEGSSPENPNWRILSWDLQTLETIDSERLLFVEALDSALPLEKDLARARESEHEQAVIRYYRRGAQQIPEKYFTPISANLKPGISVVDIDNDGWDDLYVTVRMGRNQLLRNQGDGTFREESARWGLDIDGHSTCAIFADFDNDGDPDLMLGRSLSRSMYLENTGRRFTPQDFGKDNHPLPYLVVSMSAADFNNDGLLDVYFSTYRPAVLENIVAGSSQADSSPDSETDHENSPLGDVASKSNAWPDEFLSRQHAAEYHRRTQEKSITADRYGNILNQIGPPNVLVINQGHRAGQGRFEVSKESKKLELWRNTLQATWADFDEDGDVDLYVANDWSPDNLLRNDGPEGFVDITQQAGTDKFGFAMGATWGDYDNDGRQDLYVSNMYSKAGRRITAQIAELDPQYARSVEGNFLYHNQGKSRFELVSGLQPPALTVASAGWSWGGQFADLNNDGFLDLYVLSGYFTAPKKFASQVDL